MNLTRWQRTISGLLGLMFILLITPMTVLSAVPLTFNYQGYLTDSSGNAITVPTNMTFSIYDVSTGGTPLWTETQAVDVNNGVYSVVLGDNPANDLSTLSFAVQYYLGVKVESDTEMTDRQPLTAVPYAINADEASFAGDADTVDGMHASQLQSRVNGSCSAGSSIRVINSNGSVTCETDDGISSETDPSVNALGKASLSCTSGQVAKWNGSSWSCADDSSGGGSTYSAGTGLNLSGSTFSVDIPLSLSSSSSLPVLSVTNIGSGDAASFSGDVNTTGDYKINNSKMLSASLQNTLVGVDAGTSMAGGDWNTYVGYWAGYSTTTGAFNVALGYGSGYFNNGVENLFVGYQSGFSNSGGSENSFLGANSGAYNTSGGRNIFIGNSAGFFNTTGSRNTAIGYGSGFNNSEGTDNVFIGYQAGFNETGSHKLYISNSDTSSPLIYGEFDNAVVSINGKLGVGTASPSPYKLYVVGTAYATNQWVQGSDMRWKKNIRVIDSALEKVLGLRGVSYNWDTDHFPDKGFTEERQIGFIAQDIEPVIPEVVRTDEEGYKSVAYDKLTAVLVEALKELKAENDSLKDRIEKLEQKISH